MRRVLRARWSCLVYSEICSVSSMNIAATMPLDYHELSADSPGRFNPKSLNITSSPQPIEHRCTIHKIEKNIVIIIYTHFIKYGPRKYIWSFL